MMESRAGRCIGAGTIALLWAGFVLATAGCPQPSGPPIQPLATPPETPTDPPTASANEQAPPAEETPAPPSDSSAVDPVPPGAAVEPGDNSTAATPLTPDWPAGTIVLYFTGEQHGYIEPCGCTGLENQKGGLARRHTLHAHLVDRGFSVVPLDAGNQVRRFGRQAEIKFQMTAEGLRTIGYQAVGLGPDDLRLSIGELAASIAAVDAERPSLFVSANADVLDLAPRWRVIEAAGRRIGVTSIVGGDAAERLAGGEVAVRAPAEALADVLPELTAAECDLYVLLAHAPLAETEELARRFPLFQVVATTGGAAEPPHEWRRVEGGAAQLVQLGAKGMHAALVGWNPNDADQPLRYVRAPLDARLADSRAMLDLLASYQSQLQTLGLAGLEVRAAPHPSGRQFVGSEKCGECHTSAFAVWEKTPHAHATDSLVYPNERSEIVRHFDPECLSCHVTGWNPQGYYPYQSGYLSLDKSQHLFGSGCENCHGPGSEHVAAESGDIDADDELLERLRESMRLTLEQARRQKCFECHDIDNSPDFHAPGAFEKYWERIEHRGKD